MVVMTRFMIVWDSGSRRPQDHPAGQMKVTPRKHREVAEFSTVLEEIAMEGEASRADCREIAFTPKSEAE
jgi:hypothetical protein